MKDTKNRIIDSAENLFSQNGFSSTSVRDITSLANANIAALNYHFGSKERLISAVFSRRIGPLNTERLRILEQYSNDAKDGVPSLQQAVTALVGPALRLSQNDESGGQQFMCLMGRAFSNPDKGIEKDLLRLYEPLAKRFIPIFRHHLCDLPDHDFFWRIHFMIGLMSYTMAASHRLSFISNGTCSMRDPEETIKHLVNFVLSGLLAPRDKKA